MLSQVDLGADALDASSASRLVADRGGRLPYGLAELHELSCVFPTATVSGELLGQAGNFRGAQGLAFDPLLPAVERVGPSSQDGEVLTAAPGGVEVPVKGGSRCLNLCLSLARRARAVAASTRTS